MSTVVTGYLIEHRPWGSFTTLEQGENHKVKRLVLKPGQRFSLQYHNHRCEHWVIVAGTGLVTIDNNIRAVMPNESIYIPVGAIHRLENTGDESLIVIEVQYGSYLEEDDIVRLADDYHRES